MAKYTMELREIVTNNTVLFDFPYEFYDDTKKTAFENAFINHFYFHEIGVETVGRFKHNLAMTFNEKLPYYNMLFETAKIKYDTVNNYNVNETYTRNIENDTNKNNVKSASGSDTSRDDLTDRITKSETNTGVASSNGSVIGVGSQDSTVNKSVTSEVDSNTSGNTQHKGRTEGEEERELQKTSTRETNKIDVKSDTPLTPFTLEKLKTNQWGTEATTGDTEEKVTDKETNKGTKFEETNDETISETGSNSSSEVNDNTQSSGNDRTSTTSTDTNNVTSTIVGNDTLNSNRTNSTTRIISENNALTGKDKQKEIYERNMIGNIGVTSASELLEKHVKFQKYVTNIELQFFNECNNLFMMVL